MRAITKSNMDRAGTVQYKSHREGSLLCWSSHLAVGRIQESESSAVERNAQDSLVRDGAQLEEIVPGVVNIQHQVLSTLTRPGLQWSVVSSLLVPLAVVVVAHHVDVVQVLVHLGDVVGRVDGASRGSDGGGEHQVLRSEDLVEVLDQQDEVLLVLGHSASLARVLPVKVQTVEVVSPDEAEGAGRELVPLVLVPGHQAVVLTALVPPPDSEGDLERREGG